MLENLSNPDTAGNRGSLTDGRYLDPEGLSHHRKIGPVNSSVPGSEHPMDMRRVPVTWREREEASFCIITDSKVLFEVLLLQADESAEYFNYRGWTKLRINSIGDVAYICYVHTAANHTSTLNLATEGASVTPGSTTRPRRTVYMAMLQTEGDMQIQISM